MTEVRVTLTEHIEKQPAGGDKHFKGEHQCHCNRTDHIVKMSENKNGLFGLNLRLGLGISGSSVFRVSFKIILYYFMALPAINHSRELAASST